MRTILILIIVASLGVFGYTQEQKPLTLTYKHGIKLDAIQTPGSGLSFKQHCTTLIDSVISTGNIRFEHSKIGKIKDCILEWQIQQDILRVLLIETFDKKQTENVLKQATFQFGEPDKIQDGMQVLYRWSTIPNKPALYAELNVDESAEIGRLIVGIRSTNENQNKK